MVNTPLRYTLTLTFKSTNDEAELETIITELKLARGIITTSLRVKYDSQQVVNQVKWKYVVTDKKMKNYQGKSK